MKPSQKESDRRMKFALERAAQVWCEPSVSDRCMDPDLATEFAKILVKYMYEPHLGCATTEELLNEVKIRCEVNGTLQYKTVGFILYQKVHSL